MSDDLPMGWELVDFEDVCGSGQYGWTSSASNEGTVKYLRTTDITKGEINWNLVPYCQEIPADLEKYRLQKNDILISRAGSVGFSSLIDETPCLTLFASYLIRFVPLKQVKPYYIAYFLKSSDYWKQVADVASGIALANINAKKISKIQVPLPPLNEQRRIVDKLERIGDRDRTARNELNHIPKLIARYKQAVLAAACSGKLTEDWRCNNLDIDSASNFLEKCLIERRYLADNVESIARKSKYKEPIAFTGETPFEIPENWAWVSADQVSSQITDGEHIQPPYQVEGLPMLSAKHVRDGYVEMSDLKFISQEDFEKAALRCYPKNGDILIVSVGATTGRAAIVSDCPPFVIVRSVLLLKPLIEAKFIYYWINSPFCQDWISKASGASAQPHFYINDNKRMPIPLPPEKELQEIVRRVEKMFEKIDRMEEEYQKAAKLCDRLEQATLAKAFRGELVPQDPDDEPASVLLEQVKREKEKGKIKSKK